MIDPRDLIEVVQETLDGIVETIESPFPSRPHEPPPARVRATVDIVGEHRASFQLTTDGATALAMAEVWAGIPSDDITGEDASATIAELCNVLAGSVKTLFQEETHLEVPTVEIDAPTNGEPPVTIDHILGVFDVVLTEPAPVSVRGLGFSRS